MFTAALLTLTTSVCALNFLNHRVQRDARPYLVDLDQARPAEAALIFGAYAGPDGTPCPVLQDRLRVGLALWQAGTVQRLILSGDHGAADYDEVEAMRRYLQNQGAPSSVLILDHGGYDTYDSLYRARSVFGATDLILVTQNFHLSRALYLGRKLGLKVQGVSADLRTIREIKSLKRREMAANVKALWDLYSRREPLYLGPLVSDGDDAAQPRT